ncbi:hypothetical protein CERSUDRAFT_116174 [Gelatoporia subvermispora B]|uniref:F-box domain-containing protein n=1 Tax=Ceriporiopsis subvermispora (strain B) TaxID=914234 RepID=M2R9H5_CERS8|nr:hypothetical protein CERSUDRAFT_116174 [Gelatoporia subvermispora B]
MSLDSRDATPESQCADSTHGWNLESANKKHWKRYLETLQSHNMHMSFDDLRELDRELIKAQVLVRRVLNSKLPIHRLPTEVLTLIFYRVPESSISPKKVIWCPAIFRMKDVIALAAVCRQWRDVVYGAAILWSSVNRLGVVGGHLKRTCGARLNVQVRRVDKNTKQLQSFFVNYGSRLRELHVLGPEDSLSVNFPPLQKAHFDATNMEVLSLIGLLNTPHVLKLPTLNLRRLVIINSTNLTLPTGQLERLTQLCLSKTNTISTIQVLNLFSRAPALQDAQLINTFDDGNAVPFSSDNIFMKHLRRLSIKADDPDKVSSFLSHLIIEPTMALRIRYNYSRITMPSDYKLPDSLTPITEPISHLTVIRRGISLKFIAASSTSGIALDWMVSYCEDQDLSLSFYSDMLPRARLQEVSFVWVNSYSKSLPPDLAQALPDSVGTLNTSTVYLEYLVDEFGLDGPAPCPNLATLRVMIDRQRSRADLALSKICPCLTEIAERREKVGHPLQCVIFASFNNEDGEKLKLSGINALKRVVRVEYEAHSELPAMEMPAVCTTGDGSWWPSWNYQWKDAGPGIIDDWVEDEDVSTSDWGSQSDTPAGDDLD